jgi:DNA polymerase III epsilon subunit-like protein
MAKITLVAANGAKPGLDRDEQLDALNQPMGGQIGTPVIGEPAVDPAVQDPVVDPFAPTQGPVGELSSGATVIYPNPEGGYDTEGSFSHYDGETRQAIITPKDGGPAVQIDPSQVRAEASLEAALVALDIKYSNDLKEVDAKVAALKLDPKSQAYRKAKAQAVVQKSNIKKAKVEAANLLKSADYAAEQESMEVGAPTEEESAAKVSEALKTDRDPVDVYLEDALGEDPNDTETFARNKAEIMSHDENVKDFHKWAFDNKSLPEIVAWSNMQQTLDLEDNHFFDGITNPTKKLKKLSSMLSALTQGQVGALLGIVRGDPTLFKSSSLDEFAEAWKNEVIVILDTETLGTDSQVADVIQISAIKHYPDGRVMRFNQFVKTDKEIPASITRLTGIDKQVLLDNNARPAKEVLEEFEAFLKDSDAFVAHKAEFDSQILINNAARAGLDIEASLNSPFDSIALAKEAKPYIAKQASLGLEALVSSFKIKVDLEHVDKDAKQHRADYDTQALYQVLGHLLNAHKASVNNSVSLPKNSEAEVREAARQLFDMFPDTNPEEALSTMLFANEYASGTLPVGEPGIISSNNKAASLASLHSLTGTVNYKLMEMLANVMSEEGIEAVAEGANELTGTNVTFTKTLIALAEQFGASKNTSGMDAELSFAMTLAVFAGSLEGYTAEPSLDEKHITPAEAYQEEQQIAINEAKTHLMIGEKLQQLLGISGIDAAVTASLGAIALKAVASASLVDQNTGIGYFNTDGKMNLQGRTFAYDVAPLAESMFGTKRDRDKFRKDEILPKGGKKSGRISLKEWEDDKRFNNIHILKKSAFDEKGSMDPKDMLEHIKTQLDYDPAWMREALLELHNMAYTWDTDLVMRIDDLLSDPASNKLLKIRGYEGPEGTVEGSFQNGRNRYIDKLDSNGAPILKADFLEEQKEYHDLLAKQERRTITAPELTRMWKLQEYVFDAHSTDPKFSRETVQEAYQGDILKDTVVQRFISMVAPKNQDGTFNTNELASGAFYTDWFYGLNGRAYMKQYIGNFQSSKLARASVQSDKTVMYDTPQKITQLKAGVMKKFGGKYAKMSVAESADLFNEHAAKWHSLMYADGATEQDWKANAAVILNGSVDPVTGTSAGGANQHEGFLSLSAMHEGARLWQLYQVKDAKGNATIGGNIASRFFTEVDGVANGTAHNAMQSGSFEAAAATNLNPLIALNSGLFEKSKGRHGEDVYAISGAALIELIAKETDKPYLKELFEGIGLYDTSKDSKALRDFMKKPMMIFGYGAGEITIIKTVKEGLEEMISDKGLSAKIESIISKFEGTGSGKINLDGKTKINWFADEVGRFANKAVSQNFGAIKSMTKMLSAIAKLAVDQGITPSIKLPNGNIIVFGMRVESPKQVSFTKHDYDEAWVSWSRAWDADNKSPTAKTKQMLRKAQRRLDKVRASTDLFNDPITIVSSGFDPAAKTGRRESGSEYVLDKTYINMNKYSTDPDVRAAIDGAVLKAATQAAVLITHNFDSINMLNGIMKARKLGAGSAAQVFDGIFMTPLDAKNYSKQLNKEFLRLHSEFFYLNQFMSDIKKIIEDDVVDPKTGKMKKRRMDMKPVQALYAEMNKTLAAHKRLLKSFEFGSRFIKQFFWDGASKRNLDLVEKMLAKAESQGKKLHSVVDPANPELENLLRGKGVSNDRIFDNSLLQPVGTFDQIGSFQ